MAFLLFLSGCCALAYQVAWLRELRLVFGASTSASAAVLAIFMGGLGLGGSLLGRYADRHRNPLQLYAQLELLIAGCVLLTPYLLSLVRTIYIVLGGVSSLGIITATGVRLLLAAAVLGVPTFLMGGTLPAAARVVVGDSDQNRSTLGFLYGINTFGAVVGVSGMTFYMLEAFGTRQSLQLFCLLNAMVGMVALLASYAPQGEVERLPAARDDVSCSPAGGIRHPRARMIFIYAAACVVGFVFFLMELVWYRMLAPVLGGSTYTFGLILAVALAGIGIGGWFYSQRERPGRVSMDLFAVTCGLEALGMAIPFALGDRIAVFAVLTRMIAAGGFGLQALGWVMVALIVVLPTAIVAGFQFPLLVGLLGCGGKDVGKHTGFVYAWNTVGAILGSLAGGFGIMVLLSAPGCWLLAVVLLAILSLAAAGFALLEQRRPGLLIFSTGLACIAVFLLFADGPTAFWRHNPIGAGRAQNIINNRNEIKSFINQWRRSVVWEADGVESSVGIDQLNSISFVINGKSDGNAKSDAPTQVMAPLVSAVFHPEPKRSLVIGLGTGSSAGWLADVPSMEAVDVVELEPAILEVARRCAPANRNVLQNPKVRAIIGDAREILQTTKERYDLIFSEPSNPYRAGVASLYTLEFYQAVAERLADGGYFSQWVQGYEVDTETIRVIYATIGQVFPFVETWQTMEGDLLFVCYMENKQHDASVLRQRIAEEPFRSALLNAWWAIDLEGFLARFVARPSLARSVAEQEREGGRINTDDRMFVEFAFSRSVGRQLGFFVEDIRRVARKAEQDLPDTISGEIDRQRVLDNRMFIHAVQGSQIPVTFLQTREQRVRGTAFNNYIRGNIKAAQGFWKQQSRQPENPLELALASEALAVAGDETAKPVIMKLREFWPATADLIMARYYAMRGNKGPAIEALEKAILSFRADPWSPQLTIFRALYMAKELAREDRVSAERFYQLLSEPFSIHVLEEKRLLVLLEIGRQIDFEHGAEALKNFEPHVPWNEAFLRYRYTCYRLTSNPLAEQAEKDLQEFLQNTPTRFASTD